MEEQRIHVALGQQPEEALPVAAEVGHERQVLAAGFGGDTRVALVVEPGVAHRDVFPSHAAARGRHGRAHVFHFHAALQSDDGAKLEPADWALGWYFREM